MIEIPEVPGSFGIPPFDELTMIIFGIPGSGKTRFCAGCPDTVFISTEPGQAFTKARVLPVRDWGTFREVVHAIAEAQKAGRTDIRSVAIDIVDNLYIYCRDYICRQKNLAYPPATDYGKTWAEITKEWSTWIRALMDLVNVRFISHTTTTPVEVTNDLGIKEEVEMFVPTFKGKAAQYLDGIVHAMGFMIKNRSGEHCITFKQTPTIGAKDRADLLSRLGDIRLPPDPDAGWAHVRKNYEHVAASQGLEVEAGRGIR